MEPSEGYGAIGSAVTANTPDLLGELGATFGRRRLNHFDRILDIHVVGLTLHGQDSAYPLA